MRKKIVAGNWKMNGLKASLAEFEAMREGAAAVAAHVQRGVGEAGQQDLAVRRLPVPLCRQRRHEHRGNEW